MKKTLALPLLAVVGGAAAFALRLLQNRTGFEPGTGLPVPGNLPGVALLAVLAALAAAVCLLVRRMPPESGDGPAFPGAFAAWDPAPLMVPVAGVFLMALSGLLDLAGGIGLSQSLAAADPYGGVAALLAADAFSPRLRVVMGALTLLSAAGLFRCTALCRGGKHAAAFSGGAWLLMPPAVLVVRLVLTYRADSVNPALEAYYVELLALVFLTLGFYRLSSFAFRAGRTRVFSVYAALSVTLSLASLADAGIPWASRLLYIGGALVLLGFLGLRLADAALPAASQPDEPTDGSM